MRFHSMYAKVIILTVFLLSIQVVQADSSTNLVINGTFNKLDRNGLPERWTASGNILRSRLMSKGGPAGKDALLIEATGRKIFTLTQTVKAKPNTTYLFQADVKSTDSVVVTVGKRRMSYSTESKWQTICDIVRTSNTEKIVRIHFALGGRHDKYNQVYLADVRLRKVERPKLPKRKLYDKTILASGGKAESLIIYPSQHKVYRKLALTVQKKIKDFYRVEIPIISDVAATQTDAPVIKDEFRAFNLILLGRLGVNRAMWIAYNRFLCAADGYYPGGDGYVVRTASNALRNGRNMIILGGSNENGTEKAVNKFISLVKEKVKASNGVLTLPYTLEVELGGKCLRTFEADEGLWTKTPHDPKLPKKKEAGYQSVIRWYMNAMGYYWTGWKSYKKRSQEFLDIVLKESSKTHHYIVEFFVRTYDMLDDSGIYKPEQIHAVDNLIFKNAFEFLTSTDLGWMTLFNPPYENIPVTNRHSIASWIADLTMMDFLHDYCNLPQDVKKVVEYRRAEKHPFLRHCVLERWQPSLPRAVKGGHTEEINASFFRYALHNEIYEFFNNGNARRALLADDMIYGSSLVLDDHLIEGILASYYRDGRYLWLLRNSPAMPWYKLFQYRYVCGVHRYVPGDEVKPADPASLCGVVAPPLMPHDEKLWGKTKYKLHKNATVPVSESTERVTFRNGFRKGDDLMILDTAGIYNGVIKWFSSEGKRLLMISRSSTFGEGAPSYWDYNALSVIRIDKIIEDPKPYAGAARVNWLANFGNSGGVSVSINPFMTTKWTREIIWLKPRLYVVRDVVEALEDGEYLVNINWRPQGKPSWDGFTWTGANANVSFRITPLGAGFKVVQNVKDYLKGLAKYPVFRQTTSRRLKRGQKMTAMALLQVEKGKQFYKPVLRSDNELALVPDSKMDEATIILWRPGKRKNLETDAEVLIVSPEKIQAIWVEKCEVNGNALIRSNKKFNASLDWKNSICIVDNGGKDLKRLDLPGSTGKAVIEAIETTGFPGVSSNQIALPVEEHMKQWRSSWIYKGLLRPGLVTPIKHLGKGVYDFGREVRFGEIRAEFATKYYQPAPMPKNLRFLKNVAQGKALPPENSPAWVRPNEKPVWKPGVETANYGSAVPKEKCRQVIYPKNFRARFVRGGTPGIKILYYDADQQRARCPLFLEVVDMDSDGKQEILAAPDIFPKFVRATAQEEDTALTVITPDGKERFQYKSEQFIQEVRLLGNDRSGKKRVFVLTKDAKLRLFNPNGSLYRLDDLYKMHQNFNEIEGRENTRHPAGGFTMPYSVGLWRPNPQGDYQTIISRYSSFSFLHQKGDLKGVLMGGGYVLSRLLPYGVDLNGDKVLDQLCLGKGVLALISGSDKPRIPDPKGDYYYPQIHSYIAIVEPGFSRANVVDGVPTFVFSTLPFKKTKGVYVLSVRETYVGIFDGVGNKWVFSWTPPAPINAAAITKADQEGLVVVVCVGGSMLWQLQWQGDLAKLKSFKVRTIDDSVNKIASISASPGQMLLSCAKGLYLLNNFTKLIKLADGSYQDAKVFDTNKKVVRSVVAITTKGEVIRYNRK